MKQTQIPFKRRSARILSCLVLLIMTLVLFWSTLPGTAGAAEGTLTPPALIADSTGNIPGQAVELTFTDDTAWRGAITGVTVNGASVTGQYTVAEGRLTIDAGVFTTAGDYAVVVTATGYPDAAVTQTMLAATWPSTVADGYITTIAGNGTSGYSGDGGPAIGAQMKTIYDVTLDNAGNLYISDTNNRCVRMVPTTSGAYYGISMTAGNIYTVAGTGASGYSDDGGLAVSSMLKSSYGLAVDSAGNLYINDRTSGRIRKVDPSGIITTAAGMGGSGYEGDGGPAIEAKFYNARGLAVDGAGNLYIADTNNQRVRVVAAATGSLYGVSVTAGNIYTVAGTGKSGHTGDGGPATGARITSPCDVFIDSAGSLYISGRGEVRRVAPDGTITTAAGSGTNGYTGDGGPAAAAQLDNAVGLALDSAGNLYIVDETSYCIRRVDAGGVITTIAGGNGNDYTGDGGPATSAKILPHGIAADSAGNLYIAANQGVRYVQAPATVKALTGLIVSGSPDLTYNGAPLTYDLTGLTLTGQDESGGAFDLGGNTVTWAVSSGPATLSGSVLTIVRGGTVGVTAQVFGVTAAFDINVKTGDLPEINLNVGDIDTVAGIGIAGYAGDGGLPINAQLNRTYDVAFDSAGNLFIVDLGNHCVRMVAAASGAYYGIPMTAGNIYTVAGTGIQGDAGHGGPATSAQLNNPKSVAVDSAGNLYITESHHVRKVDLSGIITTVVNDESGAGALGDGGPAVSATINTVEGLLFDSAGNLYIADSGQHRVRVVAAQTGTLYGVAVTAGNIYTVAGSGAGGYDGDGGAATSAQLKSPTDMAIDNAGNLYIADQSNKRVRKVDPSGIISTVAGTGSQGYSGDGGPATDAQLAGPGNVAVDSAGNLYISDSSAFCVRKVDPSGVITTLAGTGTSGYSGDGGPAADAQVSNASGLAVDWAGNLYLADLNNFCVRYVKLAEDTTLTAPVLTADTTGNIPGQAVELTFTDDTAWRGAITGVTVNGASVTGQYTVAEGRLTIDAGVFTTAGDYAVVVTAASYPDAAVTQTILAAVWPPTLADGYITTIAGNGTSGYSGDGGLAAAAQMNSTYGVTLDSAGNLYISDTLNACVRMVAATSGAYYGIPMTAGSIYTVAGTGTSGYSDDGGPAVSSMLKTPYGLAVDSAGNLYINDKSSGRVRKVDPSGIITTVAGMGGSGYAGDGGPAVEAKFKSAQGLAVDSAGNLYIADTSNRRVRVVAAATGTLYGVSVTAGNIYTVAGTGNSGHTGDGGPATSARITNPCDVFIDSSGNLYISGRGEVRKVAPDGTITTVAGSGTDGYAGDGGPAAAAQLDNTVGLALDSAGNLYIADETGYCIRRVDAGGVITTIAGGNGNDYTGDGGPATSAKILPHGIAADSAGNLYIAANQGVRYVQAPATVKALTGLIVSGSPDLTYNGAPLTYDLTGLTLTGQDESGGAFDLGGNTVTWAVSSGPATLSGSVLTIVRGGTVGVTAQVFGVTAAFDVNVKTGDLPEINLNVGDIDTVAGIGIAGYAGDGGLPINAQLNRTYDVAFDSAGNLYISDTYNYCIRMVAAASGTYYGIPMTAGNIYTVAGSGIQGSDGDGGPATSAQLNNPKSVAVDSAGNLYITESQHVRKVDSSGVITTVVNDESGAGALGDGGPAVSATISTAYGLLFDSSGNLYIADSDQHRIRVVAAQTGALYGVAVTAGNIYTVAGTGDGGYDGDGGAATSAQLKSPQDIALDNSGNLYIADRSNYRVRKVDPSGVISTVAGTGSQGYSGDGGPAADAQLTALSSVALDSAGNLYIADSSNYRVRKVDSSGIISTVAGSGTSGYSGDGGPAADAQISAVYGLNVDRAGNLYFADLNNYCVRYVKLVEDTTLTAPVLTADSTGNTSGQAVELTFTDDAAWRGAITDVTVNGASVAGQYTVAEGRLTIDGGVFTAAGDYTIVVTATGYTSATVTQTITRQSHAVYTLTTTADTAYQSGINDDGINIMTVNDSVSGMKYFGVQITPVQAHEELEAVVFTHQRNGVQLSLNVTKADFDQVKAAQAGFNVQSGDIVKVYIVDDLTNDINSNPIILQ